MTQTLAALVAKIRLAFPAFVFETAALSEAGDDHQVVLLDDHWVFRFPRFGEQQLETFAAELRLLELLSARTPVAIPRYEFVSDAGDFGGYRLIAGRELRPSLFATLSAAAHEEILARVADFLKLVHATPPSVIGRSSGAVPHEWSGDQFRERWLAERRAMIAPAAPDFVPRADTFYDALANLPAPPREVVTHGDMSDDHMLLAHGGDRLVGVIDFADSCLGDPAYDLAYFFAYGEDAARRLVRLYDPEALDSGLADRARMHFIRFALEQLRFRSDPAWLAMVEANLTKAGF